MPFCHTMHINFYEFSYEGRVKGVCFAESFNEIPEERRNDVLKKLLNKIFALLKDPRNLGNEGSSGTY